ncbi:hypothetical protein SJI19_16770 [Acerihabitans sp. TG2]|uniref:hypothetical protein n=1 Tax=Acerihabitans sp. TG2 TaxID=3096008 RepID=UPI002B230DA6|nr:hypothetical protein [Acerihabitans sp. TG2]MEA9392179.1 hypothetical protein [Acerihabitans sp. TG2]
MMNTQPILINKFPPGAFVELDDLLSGRKISLVCQDGITSVDSVVIGFATPYLIHKSFKPVLLGSISQFVETHGLNEAYNRLLSVLVRKEMNDEANDPLFIIRSLDCLSKEKTKELSLNVIDDAIKSSKEQQQMLNELRVCIIQYIKSARENMVN